MKTQGKEPQDENTLLASILESQKKQLALSQEILGVYEEWLRDLKKEEAAKPDKNPGSCANCGEDCRRRYKYKTPGGNHVCRWCRNKLKAEAARARLRKK